MENEDFDAKKRRYFVKNDAFVWQAGRWGRWYCFMKTDDFPLKVTGFVLNMTIYTLLGRVDAVAVLRISVEMGGFSMEASTEKRNFYSKLATCTAATHHSLHIQ